MKLKKKSGLMGAVIALSAASLVSVGFASWVISQGDEKTVNGTITVDTVSEKSYLITLGAGVTGTALDQKIVFGYNETFDGLEGDTNYGWLTNTGKIGTTSENSAEVLHAEFSFTINDVTGASGDPLALLTGDNEETGYKVTASLASTDYETGTTDYPNLLGELPDAVVSYVSGNSFKCSVDFSWGEYFKIGEGESAKVVNPYTYFNRMPNTVANATLAKNVLTAVSGLAATFTITLTVAR